MQVDEFKSVDRSVFYDIESPVWVTSRSKAYGIIVDLFPVYWKKGGNYSFRFFKKEKNNWASEKKKIIIVIIITAKRNSNLLTKEQADIIGIIL